MVVMVTGGRGTLGRLLTPRLIAAGHDVILTSRSNREPPHGVRQRVLDLGKGAVPDEALHDVGTIIHAASNPAHTRKVDVEGTHRLLDAAQHAGVEHLIYPSIVGIDGHPFPYYRAKCEAERLIVEHAMPHTILRATQFHEFLDRIFHTGPVITAFSGMEFQVIDGGVVADRLVDIVAARPPGRVADLGGPRSEPMTAMAESWKPATHSRKPIVRVPVFGKSARAFRDRLHHTPNRVEGSPTWADWLATTYGP